MKCSICSFEIPAEKKCCPKCGRVITAADLKKEQERIAAKQKNNTVDDKTAVYKPASSTAKKTTQETVNINNIFSSDPNTPEYKDPHSYDRATADIIKYDKMFVNTDRNSYATDSFEIDSAENDTEPYNENKAQYYDEPSYPEDEAYFDDSDYEPYQKNADESNVIRDSKYSRPRLNFNGKFFIIAICIIIGLFVIVVGCFRIGSKLKDMKNNEPDTGASQGTVAEPNSATTAAAPPETVAPVAATLPLGKYTVTSKTGEKNIYMYKNADNECLIATIPNGVVIQIDEINDKMAKTTYNIYTGWVFLEDISYTPDAKPDDAATTSPQTTSAQDNADSQSAGEYTVTLSSDASQLNVRDMPSTDGTRIATLTDGETVMVTEVQNGWGKISINGEDGWVYMEYLQ